MFPHYALQPPDEKAILTTFNDNHNDNTFAAYTPRQQRLFRSWPPVIFLKHQKVVYWIPQVPAHEAALSGLDALAADLSKWQPAILAHQDDMELRGLTEDRITQHMELIRGIRMALADAAPESMHKYPL